MRGMDSAYYTTLFAPWSNAFSVGAKHSEADSVGGQAFPPNALPLRPDAARAWLLKFAGEKM